MLRRLLLSLVALALLPLALVAQTAAPTPAPVWPKAKPASNDFAKWEKDTAKFEAADQANPPPKGAVLFVGSSTIVRWKTLAADFPHTTVLNRGFGGNQIKDVTHYAERLIFPYAPSAIFLRAGGNDINAGWPVEEVFADFKAFVAKVRGTFPSVPIYFIGLSPTVKRLEQVAAGNQLNDLVAAYCKAERGLTYIDTRATTLDAAGKVRPELFVADMLHFNEEGYKVLVAAVRPFVPKTK
jgi:lysophospholipase L1-like esterase